MQALSLLDLMLVQDYTWETPQDDHVPLLPGLPSNMHELPSVFDLGLRSLPFCSPYLACEAGRVALSVEKKQRYAWLMTKPLERRYSCGPAQHLTHLCVVIRPLLDQYLLRMEESLVSSKPNKTER